MDELYGLEVMLQPHLDKGMLIDWVLLLREELFPTRFQKALTLRSRDLRCQVGRENLAELRSAERVIPLPLDPRRQERKLDACQRGVYILHQLATFLQRERRQHVLLKRLVQILGAATEAVLN